jgi:hypothetical protein
LSVKQIACIDSAIEKKALKLVTPVVQKEYSIKVGQRIEIKAWIARRLAADLGREFFFRNLEVTTVHNETAKAFQVSVKFVAQIVTSCHVCGRDLDTDVSRATGIGPVCADKIGLPRPTLVTAQETLASIDALCNQIGAVGPIWIPKSQIKSMISENNAQVLAVL